MWASVDPRNRLRSWWPILIMPKEMARLSPVECETLCSRAGPIVITRSKSGAAAADSIHPGLREIGLMLATSRNARDLA